MKEAICIRVCIPDFLYYSNALLLSCILAGSSKPLSLDLALPLIRQKKSQASYNPINALKEAADRQKVPCKHLESSVPQPAGSHPMFKHEITWEGQVSIAPHLVYNLDHIPAKNRACHHGKPV